MKLLVLAFLILFFSIPIFAQRRIALAPVASFDFGSPLFINRAAGVLNPFGGSGSGTSSSTSYGVGVRALVPEWIAPRFDLLSRVEAVYTTGHFTFDSIASTISGSEAKLLLEAGASWNAAPIRLNAGPWISQAIVRTISETNGTPANANSSYTHAGIFAGAAWNIPNFPLRPELTTHLDLTELSQARSNAWSFGISISYNFGRMDNRGGEAITNSALRDTASRAARARVKFLIDGAEARGNPPLDPEELHITQYTMVDAPDASPSVERWITRSYHLPELSVVYSELEGATLRVTSGQKQLFSKSLPANSPDGISILPLDDSEWQRSILELRSEDTNRLVAELRADSLVARDTLVFPPADSTTAGTVITKHESRFRLITNYAHNAGGNQVVELLLERMQALLEENPAIIVSTPSVTDPLLIRLRTIIADWDSTKVTENPDSKYVTVIFDY